MTDYRTHADLLSQVASSEHEAREVRRILGPQTQAKLREADLDAAQRWRDEPVYPHCCSSCAQGRKPCPSPQACQIALRDEDGLNAARGMVIAGAIGLSIWALAIVGWQLWG